VCWTVQCCCCVVWGACRVSQSQACGYPHNTQLLVHSSWSPVNHTLHNSCKRVPSDTVSASAMNSWQQQQQQQQSLDF
jgi:hypothetical protein